MKPTLFISMLFVSAALCYGQIIVIGDDDVSEAWRCVPTPEEEVEDDYVSPDFKGGLLYYRILSQYSDTVVEVHPGSCNCNEDANYSRLDTLTVPERVIYKGKSYLVRGIGFSAFYGCQKLRKVVLPNTITYIAPGAFDNCDSLKSINIPASVKRVCYPNYRMNPYVYEVFRRQPDSIKYRFNIPLL